MRTASQNLSIGLALLALTTLLSSACGGDDDANPGGGAAAGGSGGAGTQAGAGAGGSGGGSGSTASGGSGGSSGGSGGRSGGAGGASGAGASGGGGGGDGGSGGSDDDAGMMGTATICKAPTTAPDADLICPSADPVALALELVKDDLDTPIFVTAPPGDTDRLFVVERGGRILILDREDYSEIGTFMMVQNVDAATTPDGEKGLLGLAFHPDYPDDPRFFVNFTRAGATGLETAIVSYEVMANDPDVADPSTEQVLLSYGQPQSNHNGGMVAFGPDGCLFIGAGDGGNSDDVGAGHAAGGNGQSLDTALGKMLRIDVDDPMSGAPGNLDGAGIEHIWDYGLRNPWRFSFDRMTGDLYIGDVGQGEIEEVDVEPKGEGNLNYGWPIMEGSQCLNGGCTPPNEMVAPVDEYPHGGGDDCIVGGYVYRGSDIPSLQGFYVYADNGSGRKIRSFAWDGEGRCGDMTIPLSDRDSLSPQEDITSFGEDAGGELYMTTKGQVYKFVAQ